MEREIFRGRLVELRKENNLSQLELSRKLNVSQATVAKWENGMRLPNLEQYSDICKVLDVDERYLLGTIDYY